MLDYPTTCSRTKEMLIEIFGWRSCRILYIANKTEKWLNILNSKEDNMRVKAHPHMTRDQFLRELKRKSNSILNVFT